MRSLAECVDLMRCLPADIGTVTIETQAFSQAHSGGRLETTIEITLTRFDGDCRITHRLTGVALDACYATLLAWSKKWQPTVDDLGGIVSGMECQRDEPENTAAMLVGGDA